jgi:hypothetical protein
VQSTIDSFNSTRIIAKPGSRVPELNSEVKEILDLADFYGLYMLPNWKPRTHKHIVKCDALSKLWGPIQPLTQEAEEEVAFWYKGLKIVKPAFSNVSNVLESLRSLDHQTVLIHPVWVGTSWWPHLHTARSSYAALGSYLDTFVPQHCAYGNPQWQFQASCIQPGQ